MLASSRRSRSRSQCPIRRNWSLRQKSRS
jgi:hypothetical protein